MSVDQRWRYDALCRQTDPEIFYPAKGRSPHQAKRVCFCCPVRTECLTDALRRREPYGVWGGLTTAERKKLTRHTKGRTHSRHQAA